MGHAAAQPTAASGAIVVGTRGSDLALWQTNWVVARLRELAGGAEYRVATIKTQGDRTQALGTPLAQFGDKAVFVAELERALLAGGLDIAVQPLGDRMLLAAEAEAARAIDAAVHSLKDLPGELPAGLMLAAVTTREDPRDALVSRAGHTLASLPHGARVATSSLRRRAQLLHHRPDLRIEEIRGNVDTRVRKTLAEDGPDAAMLAVAGLRRLGLERRISEYLAVETMVPAVGQGALAVEVRRDDRRLRRLVAAVDDTPTRLAVRAERAVLAALGGGCQVPLGAHARLSADGATLDLIAVVASPDGRRYLRAAASGSAHQPARLGRRVAALLRRDGADDIIHALRQQP